MTMTQSERTGEVHGGEQVRPGRTAGPGAARRRSRRSSTSPASVMTEEGVNGLSLAEVARRLGRAAAVALQVLPVAHGDLRRAVPRGASVENLAAMRARHGGGRARPRRARSPASRPAGAGPWPTAPSPSCCSGVRCRASIPPPEAFAAERGDGRAPAARARRRRGRGSARSRRPTTRMPSTSCRRSSSACSARPSPTSRTSPGARVVSPRCSRRSCACCPPPSRSGESEISGA